VTLPSYADAPRRHTYARDAHAHHTRAFACARAAITPMSTPPTPRAGESDESVIGAFGRALSRVATTVTRTITGANDRSDDAPAPRGIIPLGLARSPTTREAALDTTPLKLDAEAVRRDSEAKSRAEVLQEIAQEREMEEAEASDEDEDDAAFAAKASEENTNVPVYTWTATLQRRVGEIELESDAEGQRTLSWTSTIERRAAEIAEEVAQENAVYRNGAPTASAKALSRINTINAPTNEAGMLSVSVGGKSVKKVLEEDSYYEAVMSDRIPAYKKPKKYIARLENLETAILDKDGKQMAVIKTTARDIEVLGPGIGLWFAQVKGMWRFFTVISCFAALAIAHYVSMANKATLDIDEEIKTTLGTTTAALVASTYGVDIRTVMAFFSTLDAVTVLLFMAVIAMMARRMRSYVIRVDEALLTLADFSVQVSGLPIDATEDEVREHFEQVGPVADVVIARSYGSVLRLRIKRSKLFQNAEQLKFELSAIRHKCKKAGKNVEDDYYYKRTWDKFCDTRQRILDLKTEIDQRMLKPFKVVYAYVTFDQESDKLTCKDDYAAYFSIFRADRTKFRVSKDERGKERFHYLRVKQSSEASDIKWENMNTVGWKQWTARRVFTALAIFVLLIGNILLVVFATSAINSDGSLLADCNVVYSSSDSENLNCPAIWNLDKNMDVSDVVAISNKNYRDRVGVADCVGFLESTLFTVNMSTYAPYTNALGAYSGLTAAQAAVQGFDSEGEWEGGLDASTLADECAAKVCYQCMCGANLLSGSITPICRDYYKEQLLIFGLEFGRLSVQSLTSIILLWSAAKFALFERHKTVSSTEQTTSRFAFFTLTTNTLVLPLLVNVNILGLTGFPILFQGSYDDTTIDWYQSVLKTLMIAVFINACWFGPSRLIVAWLSQLNRACFGGRCSTQYQLNKMYAREAFTLAERYGQCMAVVFISVSLSSAAPIVIPATSLYLFLAYWCDKVFLLRYARYPALYDHKLARQFLFYAPVACICHFAFGFWTFSQWDVPTYFLESLTSWDKSYITSQQESTFWEVRATMTKYQQLDIEARFYRANGLIQLIPLTAYTLYLIVKAILQTVGYSALMLLGCSKYLNDEWTAPVQFNSFTTAREKLLNNEAFADDALAGLPSYRVQDNPEYAALFPEAKRLENAIDGDDDE